MQIAAQMYTIRDFTKDESGITDSLKKLKAIGYNAVQLSGLGAIEPARLKSALDNAQITPCATHTPLDRILNDTNNVIAEHKLLGIKYVGLGYFKADTAKEYQDFLTKLAPAAQKLSDNGLRFVYHNHHHEFRRLDGGVRPIDIFLDNTVPANFGLLPDLYWLQVAGIDICEFLTTHKDRIKVVHFKDLTIDNDNKQAFAEVFNGNMSYKLYHQVCKDIGVEWAAVEQDTCPGNPFDSLKISLDNLKTNIPNIII